MSHQTDCPIVLRLRAYSIQVTNDKSQRDGEMEEKKRPIWPRKYRAETISLNNERFSFVIFCECGQSRREFVGLPQHLKMLYQAIVEWNCAKSPNFVMATVSLHMPVIAKKTV